LPLCTAHCILHIDCQHANWERTDIVQVQLDRATLPFQQRRVGPVATNEQPGEAAKHLALFAVGGGHVDLGRIDVTVKAGKSLWRDFGDGGNVQTHKVVIGRVSRCHGQDAFANTVYWMFARQVENTNMHSSQLQRSRSHWFPR